MAFAAVNTATGEARAWSVGPTKIQVLTYTCVSGDTSGTVTADGLASVTDCIIGGGLKVAAQTYATNVVTLTFADPIANVTGTIIVIGK
jgi:hypothetical protein